MSDSFTNNDIPDSKEILNLLPRQVENVIFHTLEDEMVLFFPGSSSVLGINNSARAIWELCDGRNTILEIRDILVEQIGNSTPEFLEDLLADVISAVFQFHQRGYLVFDETSSATISKFRTGLRRVSR